MRTIRDSTPGVATLSSLRVADTTDEPALPKSVQGIDQDIPCGCVKRLAVSLRPPVWTGPATWTAPAPHRWGRRLSCQIRAMPASSSSSALVRSGAAAGSRTDPRTTRSTDPCCRPLGVTTAQDDRFAGVARPVTAFEATPFFAAVLREAATGCWGAPSIRKALRSAAPAIHAGGFPNPVHVLPETGSTYVGTPAPGRVDFVATVLPILRAGLAAAPNTTCSAVKPYPATKSSPSRSPRHSHAHASPRLLLKFGKLAFQFFQ